MRRRVALAAALCGLWLAPHLADAQSGRSFAGGELDPDMILEALGERSPSRIRQVGTSSVTLRVDYPGDISAAYKPRTETHPRGYRAEIAAYRVSRALGMDNVPPVIGRRLLRPTIQERFDAADPADWDSVREEIRWDAPGVARGAMIYWIPEMSRSPLDTLQGLSEVAGWLQVGQPLSDDARARDLSTMLAFDYLIGNWDRFSGGNVSQTQDASRLFVRDHNVAFDQPIQPARYGRIREQLERVQRFDRAFVVRLMGLDEAALRSALAEDPESQTIPLLNEGQLAGVLMRRRALLSYVAALVALHGEAAVFPWDAADDALR